MPELPESSCRRGRLEQALLIGLRQLGIRNVRKPAVFKWRFSDGPVSVLPSDTSASGRFATGCNRRCVKPDGFELWSVTSPFQPPRVWDTHY